MRLRRHQRGAATVEFAIMAIILVPTILYYLFLEDALYFKLTSQEPVVAAPFDYQSVNYNTAATSQTQHLNRLIYCDHTSAYDSSGAAGSVSNQEFDCQGAAYASDRGHHTERGAHQCWITEGAKQITCTTASSPALGTSGAPEAWLNAYHRGGLTTCYDRIGVLNYSIVTSFFSWSANWDLSNLKYNQQWAHADADQATASNHILMPMQSLAVLTDPWALNHLAETRTTDTSGPLVDRVAVHYLRHGEAALQKTESFFTAAQNSFLSPDAKIDNRGDDPRTVPALYRTEKTRAGTRSGYGSGWADPRVSSVNRPNAYPTNW